MPDRITPLIDTASIPQKGGTTPKMQIYLLHGIFGELEDCTGVGEARIEPEEGGTFLKILGCSYLYKGDPAEGGVYKLEQAKSNLSILPREIVGGSVLYSLAAGLRFMFQRRKFIHDLNVVLEEIMWKTVRHLGRPDIRYNAPQREIVRAMEVVLRKEFNVPAEVVFPTFQAPQNTLTPGDLEGHPEELAAVLMKLTLFIATMMEWDCAYRFPLQDMFGELNKALAENDAAKEFIRIFSIATERGERLGKRFTFIRSLLPVAFFFSPRATRILKAFLMELDLEKVKLDEADWYYCLRRNTYNYRGMSLERRMEELAVIDRQKEHRYVKIQYNHHP